MRRTLALAGWLLTAELIWGAPSRADLRKLYHRPVVVSHNPLVETYLARPGIQIVVTGWGPKWRACVFEISRIQSNAALGREELAPIFREIAPDAKRGPKLGGISHMDGLGGALSERYQKVVVMWKIYSMPAPNVATGASGRVAFLDSGCNPTPDVW